MAACIAIVSAAVAITAAVRFAVNVVVTVGAVMLAVVVSIKVDVVVTPQAVTQQDVFSSIISIWKSVLQEVGHTTEEESWSYETQESA